MCRLAARPQLIWWDRASWKCSTLKATFSMAHFLSSQNNLLHLPLPLLAQLQTIFPKSKILKLDPKKGLNVFLSKANGFIIILRHSLHTNIEMNLIKSFGQDDFDWFLLVTIWVGRSCFQFASCFCHCNKQIITSLPKSIIPSSSKSNSKKSNILYLIANFSI